MKQAWVQTWREIYPRLQQDILFYCEMMNFVPMDHQRRLLLDVQAGKKRIAAKSGQGPGKTAVTTIIAGWRTLRAYKAMTVVTSPSQRQCRDIFLAEFQRQLDRAHPIMRSFIEVTKSRVVFGGTRDWEIKVATATSSANMSGYHHPNLTIMIDEAQGVGNEIFDTCQGTLTNPDSLLIVIGNPIKAEGAFYDCFTRSRMDWACHTFNCEEVSRKYPMVITPERNNLLERRYGRESNVYRCRVLGEFPLTNPQSVIGIADAEACTATPMIQCALMNSRERSFGIDLAAFGTDESVVYRRQGNSIIEWKSFRETDPSVVVRAAFDMQKKAAWSNDSCFYVFDLGGLGAGVRHIFEAEEKNFLGFLSNGVAMNEGEFSNRMTEAYFHLGKLVRSRTLHIPNDPELLTQLVSRQFDLDPKGRLRLEPKKVYKKRVSAGSPDRAEALALAFYSSLSGGGAAIMLGSKSIPLMDSLQ